MDGGIKRPAVATIDTAQAPALRPDDGTGTWPALLLLAALAAAAFGQGAYFAAVQWCAVALVAVAVAVALAGRGLPVADLRAGFAVAGLLLAAWALARATAAGTPASGLGWAALGAGTAAVVAVSRRLGAASREILLGGMLAVGLLVALTGWAGVAMHLRPWGLPAQGVWRAGSTLTYANATAALLVPLALAALARLAATPRSASLGLAATGLLTGAGATLSRAGAAALAVGLLVLCRALGTRALLRAAAGPAAGAAVALFGLVPSLRATAPASPLIAALALAAGVAIAGLLQRFASLTLALPLAVAALLAAVIVAYRAPEAQHAIRALAHARFTLASSARSGEIAAALGIIGHHPLAGVGPGHAILRWTGPGGGLSADQYTHNEYLQVLADLGVAGAVLTVSYGVTLGRLLRRARAGAPDRALWAGAVAAAAAFLVHSGFDFLWQVPAIPFTVAALAGLAAHRPLVPASDLADQRKEKLHAASHEG